MNTPAPALELPDKVYFRIGEVATLLGVKTHVVRFWQQQFPTVRPERSRTGRFLYTKATVERLHLIKHLLYAEGYTIPGARKALRAGARQASKANRTKAATAKTTKATKATEPAPTTEQASNLATAAAPPGTDGQAPTGDEPAATQAAGAQSLRVRSLEAELSAANRQVREVSALRTQVDALRTRTEEVDALRVQVAELDGLRTQVGEIAALREALANARDENASHVAALATHSSETTDAAHLRADELAAALASAQAALNRATTDTAQLRVALAARTKEVVMLNAAHAKAQAVRVTTRQTELNELKTASEHDIARLEADLAQRVDEVAGLKNDHFDAVTELKATHKRALVEATSQGVDGNAAVTRLETQVAEQAKALTAGGERLRAREEELAKFRQDHMLAVAALKTTHAAALAIVTDDSAGHQDTVALQSDRISELTEELRERSQEIGTLAGQLQLLEQSAERPQATEADLATIVAIEAERDEALTAVAKSERAEAVLVARTTELERALRESLADLRAWVSDAKTPA